MATRIIFLSGAGRGFRPREHSVSFAPDSRGRPHFEKEMTFMLRVYLVVAFSMVWVIGLRTVEKTVPGHGLWLSCPVCVSHGPTMPPGPDEPIR